MEQKLFYFKSERLFSGKMQRSFRAKVFVWQTDMLGGHRIYSQSRFRQKRLEKKLLHWK